MAVGHPRPAFSRHDERLFGRQSRACASAHRHGAGRAGTAAGGDLARLPQRQAAAFSQAADRSDRSCARAAGERRRRSRRDRVESGAQVGIQGQAHSRRTGRGDRVRRQLSRPLDHDRRILVGSAIPRRLRAVRARIQGDPVRRSGRARSGDHAEYGGLPGRAGAGRGGDDRAAGRLSGGVRPHLPQAPRADDLR